jgi:uncharacterized membrane protein YdjX (TVP38/TMEM64 family)
MRRFVVDWRRAGFVAGALLVACGLVWLRLGRADLRPEAVRDLLASVQARAGGLPIAQAALVLLLALVLVVPAVPATIFQIGSGLAFGPLWGLVYALLADVLGAAAGFALARRWGPRLLVRWRQPGTVEHIGRLANRLTWKGVVLLRLLPGPAYPLVSFAAGLSRLSFRGYLAASFVGVLPSLALLALAGDVATNSPLVAIAIVLALVASLALAGRMLKRPQ